MERVTPEVWIKGGGARAAAAAGEQLPVPGVGGGVRQKLLFPWPGWRKIKIRTMISCDADEM